MLEKPRIICSISSRGQPIGKFEDLCYLTIAKEFSHSADVAKGRTLQILRVQPTLAQHCGPDRPQKADLGSGKVGMIGQKAFKGRLNLGLTAGQAAQAQNVTHKIEQPGIGQAVNLLQHSLADIEVRAVEGGGQGCTVGGGQLLAALQLAQGRVFTGQLLDRRLDLFTIGVMLS